MKISEAPPWVREFLEKKAPWWLEGPDDYLNVTYVDSYRYVAQVEKGGHLYTLLPERSQIV